MAKRIFVLTGAGVSAESGLGTFRDEDGLWTRVDLMELATPEGYARDPARVLAFYNSRRANLMASAPNPAHFALARLEAACRDAGRRLTLVTQNVDDLHERAGSREVVHMHGELRKIRCERCGVVAAWDDDVHLATACPGCGRAGRLRPHVVWFGEMPFDMDRIYAELEAADLFVSIGTSGSVYPAAAFVSHAWRLGIRTVELNLQPSDNADAFDEKVYGPASVVVPSWVDGILRGEGW
jgi:NAD-dependent deacetylase